MVLKKQRQRKFQDVVISNDNNTSSSNNYNRSKKKKSNKPVINPIFEQAIKHIDDPYWINIFDNASKGSFPRSFSYVDDELVQKVKTKVFKTKIPQDDPELVAEICINEFKKVRGMMSKLDRDKALDDFEKHRNKNENHTWKKANKHVRSQLISDYIDMVSERDNLSHHLKSNLDTVINIALFTGDLADTNIIMDSSSFSILNITNIIYDEDNRKFMIEKTKESKKSKSKESKCEDTENNKIWKNLIYYTHGSGFKGKYKAVANKHGEVEFVIDKGNKKSKVASSNLSIDSEMSRNSDYSDNDSGYSDNDDF